MHNVGESGNKDPQTLLYSDFKTHRSRSRVRDSLLVRCPVMLGSLSVSKWTIKGCSDVIHVIDTHGIAFKHRTAREGFIVIWWITKLWLYNETLMTSSTYLVVLKRPKISGFFLSLFFRTNMSSATQNAECSQCFLAMPRICHSLSHSVNLEETSPSV